MPTILWSVTERQEREIYDVRIVNVCRLDMLRKLYYYIGGNACGKMISGPV